MAMLNQLIVPFLQLLLIVGGLQEDVSSTQTGYVVYCPCMGRFGNQAEHFLGSLAFAKGLNRTLIVPPWVEYPPGQIRSHQEPYSTYFQLAALEAYTPVIAMEEFMVNLAPTVWPPASRTVFCYRSRGTGEDCSAKEGNPFGPFWDTFEIDFTGNEYYGPLSYDTLRTEVAKLWHSRFPVDQYPVLAFTGAPATFPMQESHVKLTQYMTWSEDIFKQAEDFVAHSLSEGPFVAVHLRNGMDWKRACEHVHHDIRRNMFGSAQCLGYHLEHGSLSSELCFPSDATVLEEIRKAVEQTGAKSVFVATDNRAMLQEIQDSFQGKVKAVQHVPADPHVDLAIISLAHHFIANCISTFSAFATRYRLTHGNLPTSFWAFPSQPHDEL